MIPRGPSSPKVSSNPSHFSDQEDEAQRAEELAIYDDQILCSCFPSQSPRVLSLLLTGKRLKVAVRLAL